MEADEAPSPPWRRMPWGWQMHCHDGFRLQIWRLPREWGWACRDPGGTVCDSGVRPELGSAVAAAEVALYLARLRRRARGGS